MTPSLATSQRADASLRRAAQLAPLGQGLPIDESVRPRARQQASEKRKWRVVAIEIFSLAIHRLSVVAAHVYRLASNWSVHADNDLECSLNDCCGHRKPKSRDLFISRNLVMV